MKDPNVNDLVHLLRALADPATLLSVRQMAESVLPKAEEAKAQLDTLASRHHSLTEDRAKVEKQQTANSDLKAQLDVLMGTLQERTTQLDEERARLDRDRIEFAERNAAMAKKAEATDYKLRRKEIALEERSDEIDDKTKELDHREQACREWEGRLLSQDNELKGQIQAWKAEKKAAK